MQSRHEGDVPKQVELELEKGKTVSVRIDYLPAFDNTSMGFGIKALDEPIPSAAKKTSMATRRNFLSTLCALPITGFLASRGGLNRIASALSRSLAFSG